MSNHLHISYSFFHTTVAELHCVLLKEKPHGLQSLKYLLLDILQKKHDYSGEVRDVGSITGSGRFPWSRKWQPTPVFLPGKAMDRGAWWATVHRVAKRQTQLK